MNFAQLNASGIPSQVVDCIDGEEPGAPEAGEVLVEMLACPIDPAELLIIERRLPRPRHLERRDRLKESLHDEARRRNPSLDGFLLPSVPRRGRGRFRFGFST